MIDVVVVAAYPMIRAGLRALLEATTDCSVVGEAGERHGGRDAGQPRGARDRPPGRRAGRSQRPRRASKPRPRPARGWPGRAARRERERYLPGTSRGADWATCHGTPRRGGRSGKPVSGAVASGLVVLAPRVVPSLVVAPRRPRRRPTEVTHGARAGVPRAPRPGPAEQGHRAAPRHQRAHGEVSRRGDPRQAGRRQPNRGPCRRAGRLADAARRGRAC